MNQAWLNPGALTMSTGYYVSFSNSLFYSVCIFWSEMGLLEAACVCVCKTKYTYKIHKIHTNIYNKKYIYILLSIQLPYIFWSDHLSHLHLRWLLIDTYVVPFIVRLFSSVFFFFSSSLFLLLLQEEENICCSTGLVLTNFFSFFLFGSYLFFLWF